MNTPNPQYMGQQPQQPYPQQPGVVGPTATPNSQYQQQVGQTQQPGMPQQPTPVVEYQPPDENEIMFFASTNYRNENRRFGVKVDDRRRHMYFIGKTGMGKSTVLENMIIQDIRNGKGLAVVDPHGDLVEKVVKFVPSERVNDIIYFNPSDLDSPIAFNILENVDPEYKNLVSNGLVGVFKKIWADSWGPRLEYILINAILALLEYPGSTLLGVTRMLVDTKYRKKVVKNITDPVVKSFWIDEYNNYSEKFRNEAIAPIQNKVGQFLSSSLIRNIVGQPKSTIGMREIMDEGKVLLMNLSKGRIGEENAALLGAMMITKIQLAAMSRVDIPENTRRDFYLYVDEFQNFSTESFANILSEARKYRLNLIMAHQYIEQLSDEVRAAVFGNVGTIIAFRVGAVDAEALEMEFQPTFTQEDIVTLPSYHIYLRLMINGVASEPFSASTLPPVTGETGNHEKVIAVSRERYSRSRSEVEEKILRWSGHTSAEEDEDEDEDNNRYKSSGKSRDDRGKSRDDRGSGKSDRKSSSNDRQKNKSGFDKKRKDRDDQQSQRSHSPATVPQPLQPATQPSIPVVPQPATTAQAPAVPQPLQPSVQPASPYGVQEQVVAPNIPTPPYVPKPPVLNPAPLVAPQVPQPPIKTTQPIVPVANRIDPPIQRTSSSSSLADVLPAAPRKVDSVPEYNDEPVSARQSRSAAPVIKSQRSGDYIDSASAADNKKRKRRRPRKKKNGDDKPATSGGSSTGGLSNSQPKTIKPGQNVQFDS